MRRSLRGGTAYIYKPAAYWPGRFSVTTGGVGMIVFALMIGLYSIGLSYLRVHRRPLPVILLVTGFAIIILGHVFLSGSIEGVIVPVGGLLIAVAHFINYRCAGPHPMS